MATYLKRTSKLFDLSLSRASAEVNLRDLMCPVCRGILIEPVTLPCTHSLCLRCLKGTFEHNSLSCPLCRVRVGSWLRTATKSETLVNNGLWELIRTRFPKEVQGKHNGEESESELESGFVTTNKILSAAGEIRREYEAQLQIAEEEIRRQREAERIASEALIRKIQAEERQQLAQLAQDQLLAKNLAKKTVVDTDKSMVKYMNESSRAPGIDYALEKSKSQSKIPTMTNLEPSKLGAILKAEKTSHVKVKDNTDPWKSNIALISKIRAERYSSSMKSGVSSIYKNSPDKFCCQKSIPVHNAVTRTLKHQAVTKITQPSCSNYTSEPGCSNSKIYGMQSKEELHVPSDVLNSKKKRLGVEVCVTIAEDDGRIGSAESAGSHDSINQEIHHFKPIKAMPRTPLRLTADGRQIDPKLVRVVALLKHVPNPVLKPPSPTHLKRTLGCSWSAFRGKVREDSKMKRRASCLERMGEECERKLPTSQIPSQSSTTKLGKSQISETVRRLDLVPELSFDNNKNYTKNINRIINGTKVSKKLILDENVESGKISKPWKSQMKNGTTPKSKRRKHSTDRKDVWHELDAKDEDEDESEDSNSSFGNTKATFDDKKLSELLEGTPAIENIAERIKKRKMCNTRSSQDPAKETETPQTDSKRRRPSGRRNTSSQRSVDCEETSSTTESKTKRKRAVKSDSGPKRKRQMSIRTREAFDELEENSSMDSTDNDTAYTVSKSFRKAFRGFDHGNKRTTRNNSKDNDPDAKDDRLSGNTSHENSSELNGQRSYDYTPKDSGSDLDGAPTGSLDDDVIEEQKRIERLVLQEKEDFELALRLQAEFDGMGRIAGRTRGSRRAIESGSAGINTNERTLKKAQRSPAPEEQSKRRGRPPKRAHK